MQRLQLALAFLLALGLIVRIALGWHQSQDLLADNDGYLAHAAVVASGDGFQGPYSHQPTAFRPPGYPVLLGLLKAGGASDSGAVIVVSLVCYFVIFAFTRSLARQYGLDPCWSALAVFGVACDPLLVRYSILPMTEVPCAAVLLAALVTFRKAVGSGSSGDQNSPWSGIIAGVLFGLGTLVRPVVLLVCLFVTLFSLLRKVRQCSTGDAGLAGRLHQWFRSVSPALIAGLVLSPWVIRNAVHFHRLIPTTTHGGYTLALGNNPDFYRDVINGDDEFPWEGPALDAWQKRMIRESESQGVPAGDEPAADAWYYSQAAAAIRSEPLSFLKATGLRLRRFWAVSTNEPHGISRLIIAAVMTWYASLWAGLILQLLNFGFRILPEQRSMAMLWLAILAFLILHSVYWTDTRMRAPVMPIMIVISVSGWQSASQRFLQRVVESRKAGCHEPANPMLDASNRMHRITPTVQ
ncbi:MAG: glycosyltransferase family 39 protein [Planctomycetaceae bacterium]